MRWISGKRDTILTVANSRIQLSFRYSPASPERQDPHLLEGADLEDLLYKYFLGDIYFTIDDAQFDADWDWVPIVDFAICLRAVSKNLSKSGGGSKETFEFTESEAAIDFRRIDDEIEVSTNYASGTGTAQLTEFDEVTKRFARQVYRELVSENEHLEPDVKAKVRVRMGI